MRQTSFDYVDIMLYKLDLNSINRRSGFIQNSYWLLKDNTEVSFVTVEQIPPLQLKYKMKFTYIINLSINGWK